MAFLIIEVMADIGRPVALSDLARQVGVSKVRVFRFLRTLLQLGYVLLVLPGWTIRLHPNGRLIADKMTEH